MRRGYLDLWLRGAAMAVLALLALASGALSSPAQADLAAGYTFTGHVYEGYKPSTSAPLGGVSVGLWGDADEWPEGGSARVQLATTTTNSSGAFTLSWGGGATYPYLHVLEVDPATHWSTGAEAVSPGYVKNYNCISYYIRYLEQNTTYSGSAFWDARQATATPTRTATRPPSPTPTFTRTPTATRVSSATSTATGTRPPSPTPTRTPTGTRPPTATPTATTSCPRLSLSSSLVLTSHPNHIATMGDTLVYVLTATNNGSSVVPAMMITDTFPLAYLALAPGQSGFSGGGSSATEQWVEWTGHGPGGAGYAPGQSFSVTLRLVAIAAAPAPGQAVNNAEFAILPYGSCEGATGALALGVQINCPPLSYIMSIKLVSHPGDVAAIGDTLTYVLTLTNNSVVAVPAGIITATFPTAYLELAPGQTGFSDGGSTPTQQWVEWTSHGPGGAGFGPGESMVVSLKLRAIAAATGTEARVVAHYVIPPFGPCPGLDGWGIAYDVEIGCPALSLTVTKALVGHPRGLAVVGDTLTFLITLTNTSSAWVPAATVEDRFPTAYFELVPGQSFSSWALLPGEELVSWTTYGPANDGIGPGRSVVFTLLLKAKAPGSDTEAVNRARGVLAPFYPCQGPEQSASAGVTITEPTGDVVVTKTLVDPLHGEGQVGGVARFRLHVENVGNATATFNVEDTFAEADFAFVSASPMPSEDLTDGVTHLLRWANRTLAPGLSLDILVDLRMLHPGVLPNCAYYTTAFSADIAGLLGPRSCAEVRVPVERDIWVQKYFTSPPFHLARVGDPLSFTTDMRTLGPAAISSFSLHDYFVPQSIGNPGDWWLDFHWDLTASFAVGFVAGYQPTTGPTVGTAYPARNYAVWTVTYPDGHKITKTVSDFVYIIEQPPSDGLAVRKERLSPLPAAGATVSDTVEFRLTVTNVGGAPLPIAPLVDQYDPHCLRFDSAVPPPDSTAITSAGGTLTWNNLGPLNPGQSASVVVRFHAESPCLGTINCARAADMRQGGAVAVDCLPLDIAGPRPQLAIQKTRLSGSPAPLGSLVEYRIHLQNTGGAPIPSPLPLADHYDAAFLEFDSAVPPPSHVDLPAGALTWNDVGPLAPGQGKDIIVRLRAIRPGGNIRNCASASFAVAGVPQPAQDCAMVDIQAAGPAVRILKERVLPAGIAAPDAPPAAVGEAVAFRITVRNVGGVPLAPLTVADHYDPGCLEFVTSDIPPTHIPAPGHLVWELPPLPPAAEVSWQVVLRALGPCGEVANCVHVTGHGPQGAVTEDAACAPVRLVPPEPGILVDKMVKLLAAPVAGDVVRFRLQVRNTGNTTLASVPLLDHFDPGAFEFVSAMQAPATVNLATGQVGWGNLGPLAPGESRALSLFLRVRDGCRVASNCAESHAADQYGRAVEGSDCVAFHIGGECEVHRIYLPLVLRQYRR